MTGVAADSAPGWAHPAFAVAPRPVPPPAAPPGPALRADALPTDTFVRFVLLLVTVAAAGLFLFQTLWSSVRGDVFIATWQACGIGAGALGEGLFGAETAALAQQAACRADVQREQAVVALGGTGLVLAVGWVAYRLRPRWQDRRRRLEPLDPADGEALLREVDALAAEAGLARVPTVRLDAANPGVQAFVYGAGGDARLALTGGLVVQQVLDPSAFRAVVRHELAHLANRDVPWTYYTVSAWWSFLLLALAPTAVVLAVTDTPYAVSLGTRVAVLATLVALVVASVLRAREVYADARAAGGDPEALDRVLAGQPPTSSRRPEALRLHPSATLRRTLLREPDRLFRAGWGTAVATGLAAGLALPALQSLLDLLLGASSVVAAALAVAPLLAYVLCTVSWRVALREAVRGDRSRCSVPLGLGLGVGFTVAPLLTMQSAALQVAEDLLGWTGYAGWAAAMALLFLVVARWTADLARVAVAGAVGLASPHRLFVAHVAVTTVFVVLLLVLGQLALIFLTAAGPALLLDLSFWLAVPVAALADWQRPAIPAAVLAVVAFGLLVKRLGTTPAPAGSWVWRDQGTVDGAVDGAVGAPVPADVARPDVRGLVHVGLLTGAGVGVVLVGGRALLFPLVDTEVRLSDTFVVAYGGVNLSSLVAAAGVATLAAALVVPARWWCLSLLAGVVAVGTTAVAQIAVLVAAGCGVLPAVRPICAPPEPGLVSLVLLAPAPFAAMLALAAASLGGLVRVTAARWGGRAARVAVPAPRSPRDAPSPTVGFAARRAHRGRALAAGLVGAAVVGLVAAALHLPLLRVEVPVVEGRGFTVAVPALWTGAADPGTGGARFVSLHQELLVEVQPDGAAAGADAGGDPLVVGGRLASPVSVVEEIGVRQLDYRVDVGDGSVYRVVVRGTPEALVRDRATLEALLAAVRWQAR